ncbi:SGNH/GDSL hydrolase family protein [Blastococcus atacamensis]|uniref:SGNH/GDSL hydrolase family protein n=1 Tax=Blastococcus atacamensis TaxID=2070508 RepID=UPI000CEC853F|nr:SGNH/GDSL hydrolase family protein [Blastococcus atacamensis]
MFQGFERPPWWAVGVMALCVAFLAIALPIAIDRGRVSPSELAAAESAVGSPTTSSPTSPPAPPSPGGEPATSPDETRIAIAALGDAYTAGSAMDSGEGRRWHELLTAQNSWDVTPYAVENSGFAAGRDEGRSFPDRVPEIVAARPDVVVVAGGHDDVDQPPAQVEEGIRRTLGDLRAGLPDARIVVVGVLWPGTAPAAVFGINGALREAAGGVSATFVDALNTGWFDGANLSLIGPDGTYPTDEGHVALADRIAAALVTAGVPTQV